MRSTVWLALLALLAAAPARSDEALKADLSNHVVAITTGFTGTSLVLFGARQQAGDIVIVVRGPAGRGIVRRRHHVVGFWINTERAVFDELPAFYAVISGRPLSEIAPAPVLRANGIGIANLRPELRRGRTMSAAREADFRAALIRRQERNHRFLEMTGGISFIGDHLFRATVAFPSNVPVGSYAVDVFLFRDGAKVASETVPLNITEAGVDSNVLQFAHDEALAYGIISVAATAMAGWLASLAFRTR